MRLALRHTWVRGVEESVFGKSATTDLRTCRVHARVRLWSHETLNDRLGGRENAQWTEVVR